MKEFNQVLRRHNLPQQQPKRVSIPVLPSYNVGDKLIRFDHKARSWQRSVQHGWTNISVGMARWFVDHGYVIWGVHYEV